MLDIKLSIDIVLKRIITIYISDIFNFFFIYFIDLYSRKYL